MAQAHINILVQVTEDQHRALTTAAAVRGVPASPWMKHVALAEATAILKAEEAGGRPLPAPVRTRANAEALAQVIAEPRLAAAAYPQGETMRWNTRAPATSRKHRGSK